MHFYINVGVIDIHIFDVGGPQCRDSKLRRTLMLMYFYNQDLTKKGLGTTLNNYNSTAKTVHAHLMHLRQSTTFTQEMDCKTNSWQCLHRQ